MSPLAGATITSSQATAVSDLNGSYTLTGIAAGSQLLAAAAPGYQRAEQMVTVLAGRQRYRWNFALSRATSAPIKTITFEGGSLTGSSGADSVSGSGAEPSCCRAAQGRSLGKNQGVAYLTTAFAGR